MTLKLAAVPSQSKEYKMAGGAFSLGLSVVKPDGAESAMNQVDQSVEVKIKVEAERDSRLLGLYRVNADGTIDYVGGKVKDGVLTA
ncbi:hypothetical protein GC093_23950 [Paenibacillus sp. LMG 31456]|uniref:Uncharacterized protein n=1 Tax=Paenibacillus foliorum TaxID=2654974 RepID=A0A972K2T4_9BACL|nr:hypothetical protein [Paenibacillus foliorum]NOU96250.1 hypothetical protein [Paenibacillus foliorum]